jgi:TonB family protein
LAPNRPPARLTARPCAHITLLIALSLTLTTPQGASAEEGAVELISEVTPRYPEQAIKAGSVGEVILQLTVGEDGAVMESSVREAHPSGYGFEASALEASRELRFKPPLIDGIPVQMRVVYLFRFTEEQLQAELARRGEQGLTPGKSAEEREVERASMSAFGAGPEATDVMGLSVHTRPQYHEAGAQTSSTQTLPPVAGPTGRVEGLILERGTQLAVTGAQVQIEGFAHTATTDRHGRFEFIGVPQGLARVIASADGYAREAEALRISAARGELLKIFVKPLSFSAREQAGQHLPPRVPTRHDLSVAEIRSIAGVDSDVIEAARELAGVYRPPFDMGKLGFRGVEGGGVYLLGSPLLTTHHLGGARALLPASAIGQAEVQTEYGLEAGRVGAGLIDLKLAQVSRDRMAGEAELNAYDASVSLSGSPKPRLTLSGGARLQLMRTWLEAIGAESALTYGPQHPTGQDAHLRLSYSTDKDRVDAIVIAHQSGWSRGDTAPTPALPSVRGEGGQAQRGVQAHAQWRHRDAQRRLSNTLSVAVGHLSRSDTLTVDEVNAQGLTRVHIQDHLKFRLTHPLWLTLGLEQFSEWSDLEQRGLSAPVDGAGRDLPRSPRDFTTQHMVSTHNPGLWAGVEGRWMRTHLVAGSRISYWSDTDQITPEPRLTLRYAPAFGTIFKAGGGLYTKRIDPIALDPTIGGVGLKHERHLYVTAGLEQRFTRGLWMDMSGFYRLLRDRLRPHSDPTIRLSSDGEGYAAGGDVTLRYDPLERLYGWVAYTFVYARVRDGEASSGAQQRRADIDQSHKVSVVGGFKFTPDLSLHLRWRYWRGGVYSGLPAQLFDTDRAQATFAPGIANDERLQDGHQLDLRLDYLWRFGGWRLLTYLQGSNLYNYPAQELSHPAFGVVKGAPSTLNAWPLWASAGLRAQF